LFGRGVSGRPPGLVAKPDAKVILKIREHRRMSEIGIGIGQGRVYQGESAGVEVREF